MARIITDGRVEFFAFASTGLAHALREAADYIESPRGSELDPTRASVRYEDGTYYVSIPRAEPDEPVKLDDNPGVEYSPDLDGWWADLKARNEEATRVEPEPPAGFASPLPITRTEANFGGIVCSTCDGSGCPDCTDPT